MTTLQVTDTAHTPAQDIPADGPPRRGRGRRRLLTGLGAALAVLTAYTVWTNTDAYELSASLEIDATPEEVWAVLADLSAYPEWNPYITEAEGVIEEDAGLRLLMHGESGDGTMTPTVVTADPGRELLWRGSIGPGLLFDAEHRFTIEPLEGGGVRLTQSEDFTGVAVPFYRGVLHGETLPQFEAMNEALAERVAALRDA
ncbi:SRPBCC domain-containing protein [Streptomyces sp. NPDC049881]|uniref:SRPBCC domain-containing protein n=1 Tax=unclassified Streptomyces TaxID=2593676 RepID=UPI003426CD11